MYYFTADWHLGDNRELLWRPFASAEENDQAISKCLELAGFQDGDTLFHLGDVIYDPTDSAVSVLEELRDKYPNSYFMLIRGNYDFAEEKMAALSGFFDMVVDWHIYPLTFGSAYMCHYPTTALDNHYHVSLVGHVHSLWKVNKVGAKLLVNVGVDAWHFRAVSQPQVERIVTDSRDYYDVNVFPNKKGTFPYA